MEIGIFANESDDNFLGSRDLDDEYGSEYQVSNFTIFYLLTHFTQLTRKVCLQNWAVLQCRYLPLMLCGRL